MLRAPVARKHFPSTAMRQVIPIGFQAEIVHLPASVELETTIWSQQVCDHCPWLLETECGPRASKARWSANICCQGPAAATRFAA